MGEVLRKPPGRVREEAAEGRSGASRPVVGVGGRCRGGLRVGSSLWGWSGLSHPVVCVRPCSSWPLPNPEASFPEA